MSAAQESQDQFRMCQERLGETARLGVSAVLFDSDGRKRAEIGFNEHDRFPMASIVKVPLAMFVTSEIAKGALSPDESITIESPAFSPGPIGNPLDRFYFSPFRITRTHDIGQLMAFMIHQSDNTAADALLHRLGGTCALNGFLDDLQIQGFTVTRTMHELLTYYYALEPRGCTFANVRRMVPAFSCHPVREQHLIRSAEDTCTPRGMVHLLTLLTMNPKYAEIYSHMQRCATNNQRIAEGLKESEFLVESFGHKTGSVGAIANDVGIVRFNNGCIASLAVLTYKSAVPMTLRDQQIASVTRTVIRQWRKELGDLF